MNIFTPKSKIICPYCSKKSEHPAQDYIPAHSHAVQRELCNSCDQEYLLRKIEDGCIAVDTNWTEKNLYDCHSKATA